MIGRPPQTAADRPEARTHALLARLDPVDPLDHRHPTATLSAALLHCRQAPAQVTATPILAHWLPQWRAVVDAHPTPIAQALLGGFQADRLAWAFAAGYQAAMHRLLVVARLDDGQTRDRPQLCALRVPANAPGVQLDPQPATTLVPELPHSKLVLNGVLLPASALLPGNGFTDYGKPFRTLEDTLIGAATLAWLLREARARQWPAALREQLVGALALLCTVDAAAPPTAHVTASTTTATPVTTANTASALHWARQLHEQAGPLWAAAGDDPAAQRWQRDAGLIGMAGQLRRPRAAVAWAKLGG